MGKVGGVEILSKKVRKYLERNKRKDEEVLFCIVGQGNQSIIALEKRLLIIKPGFLAGATFGAKVSSFFYKDITGIEVNMGFVTGVIEISTPSYEATKERSWWGTKNNDDTRDIWKLSNCIPILKTDFPVFQPYLDKLRELIEQAKNPQEIKTSTQDDIATQLEKIVNLYKSGILTEEEYQKAKKKILGEWKT